MWLGLNVDAYMGQLEGIDEVHEILKKKLDLPDCDGRGPQPEFCDCPESRIAVYDHRDVQAQGLDPVQNTERGCGYLPVPAQVSEFADIIKMQVADHDIYRLFFLLL